MSKRNVILLIIVLSILSVVGLGLYYFYQPTKQGESATEGINFFANFNPFGPSKNTNSDNKNTTPDQGTETDQDAYNLPDSKFKKISSFPVAGYGIFSKERFVDVPNVTPTEQTDSRGQKITPVAPPTENSFAVRYVNKANGNIYQTFIDKIDERKFSSTVIPRVQEAYFGNNGANVVMRYLKSDDKTIETFLGTLPKEYLGADSIGTSEVTGVFLPENITDASVSKNGDNLFYLFNNGDNAIGVNYSFKNGTKTQVFSSPFTEWLSSWSKNLVTVTTKPSTRVPGFMYGINTDKKDFNKILGNINGLTTLMNEDGKKVLYADGDLALNIFDVGTNSTISAGLKTLPEKCAWAGISIYCSVPKYIERGQYPDSWYQGEVSFSDEIWKIDAENGNTTMVYDLSKDAENGVDGVKLTVTENENYLLLLNKKDSFLWELNLK